jgi:integrase/recombinase XerC
MTRRRYSRETVWARIAAARGWFAFVGVDWRTATFGDVEDWIAGRDVSPATSRNLLTNLRGFYRWAMRQGLTVADPTRLVDRWTVPHRLPRPAHDEHIRAVLENADPPLTAMVTLMACAGLRCCEVSRLDWSDVDLTTGRISVSGKGSKQRLIDVSDDVVRAVAGLDGMVGPIFTGAHGRRLSPERISQTVCRAFHAAGFADTAHQLRHRCATVALTMPDADLLAVRDLLGHASVATTQIYTALAPGRVADISRAMHLPA